MEEIIRVPVCPPQNYLIDEPFIDIPKAQLLIVESLHGGMRLV
jgi:hypothetical protein